MLKPLLAADFSAEALSRPARFGLSSHSFGWWLAVGGKRVRPKTALEHLQGTVFSAEALSRPARTAFFLPFSPFLRTPLVAFLFLSAAGALLSLALAVDKRVRPGKAREAKLLWLAAPSAPIALLHVGLKCDVRHSAAAEQAAGALLWFVLAAAKRVRPPSALDAKLFLLVAPWGPIVVYFPCSAPLVGARCVGKRARPGKALKTSKQSSERASQQASKPEPAKSRCQNKKKPGLAPSGGVGGTGRQPLNNIYIYIYIYILFEDRDPIVPRRKGRWSGTQWRSGTRL